MTTKSKIGLSVIALAAVLGAGWAIQGAVFAQAPNLQTPATDITLKACARLGFINADDYAAKMAVAQAELDDTYFGWWGPELPLGAAYFRVTAPSTVLEYAPQSMGGDPADHAHNMYRDPSNDYGSAWIAQ